MAYVYRHIRLDKNEPFYIGIGKKETTFLRSREKNKRNPLWKSIVKKTAYEIEILMSGLTWEEAQEKEREFIALYKCIKYGGILANLTIGGDGRTGWYGSENPNYGKKSHNRRPVLMFLRNGKAFAEFETVTQAAIEMGLQKGVIASACRKRKRKLYGDLIWEYKDNVSPDWLLKWVNAGVVVPFYGKVLPPESFKTAPREWQSQLLFEQHNNPVEDSQL